MTETSPTAKKPVGIKLSSMRADRATERAGDWIPAVDIDPSVSWYVRSTNYPPFKIARDHASNRLSRQFKEKAVPDDDMALVNGELAVEHLLLGWKGLFEDDGKTPIDFTPERATQILTDDEYRAVRASVYLAATKVGRTEVEIVEDTAKN